MSSLLFLESDDFHIQKGTKGNIMCTSIASFSLILFYSTQCIHCKTLIPVFKILPSVLGGVSYGLVNISNCRDVISKAKDTISPLLFVPQIILYVNGRPYMAYKGEYTIEALKRFVIDITSMIQNKQKSANSEFVIKEDARGLKIPQYSLGQPLHGDIDNICYLDFDEAYVKTK